MALRHKMRIEFLRNPSKFPFARTTDPDWQALADLLSSDVYDEANANELIARLRRAATGGDALDQTGNAVTVEAHGADALVECAIDESIPTVKIATLELVSLLEAWVSYIRRGSPTHWSLAQ